MSDTTDLLGHAFEKNPVDFADAFNQLMQQKAQAAVENHRITLAQSIYSDGTEPAEDDVDLEDEADETTEDDFDFSDEDLEDIDDLEDLDLEDLDLEDLDLDDDNEDFTDDQEDA